MDKFDSQENLDPLQHYTIHLTLVNAIGDLWGVSFNIGTYFLRQEAVKMIYLVLMVKGRP